jgi:hypothetical protein
MSRVQDGSYKSQLYSMVDEYFEMIDQMYGDVTENLKASKAQLKLLHEQQNQRPLSTLLSEQNTLVKG